MDRTLLGFRRVNIKCGDVFEATARANQRQLCDARAGVRH